MSEITVKIGNCMDCPYSVVCPDPDPDDWFCDDDKKVLCMCDDKTRVITCACRPYNLRKECEIPSWCPRRK